MSPIGALPPELLFKIFEFYISDEIGLPETLLLVCRYWRDAALHVPTLWSNIRVPEYPPKQLENVLAFLQKRCLRSHQSPIHLDLVISAPIEPIIQIPTLMERCVGITIRRSDHWGFIAHLPQLEYLTLALRSHPPPGLELRPTAELKNLKIELPLHLPSCPLQIISHLQSELELCFSWFATSRPDLCRVASAATQLPRLRLNIIETPQFGVGLLENSFFHEECIFKEVTHLILQYADDGLDRVVWHPLEVIKVPKLERLEIWLCHLRTIEGLAQGDYLTVTQLMVVMLPVQSKPSNGSGLECEAVLELMQSLPNLELLELATPLEVMTKVQAGLRGRNLCPGLSVIRHHTCIPSR